jgi:Glycosyltransferase family 87
MKSIRKNLSSVLIVLTTIIVLTMLTSLKYRFLDIFVPGAWHGNLGYDFFSIPRSFLNLLESKSVFETDYLSYGPYATWFPYHPAVSLLLGSWLSLFAPWTSYWIFVLLSIIVLAYSSYQISKLFTNINYKALVYFLLFCTFPTYLMLWNAQIHVLLILSVTLILVSFIEQYNLPDDKKKKIITKLMIGLLISLFSKPLVLIFMPILLFTKETRYTAITVLMVYLLVSEIFFFIPFLNPAGDNSIHWTNIWNQSSFIQESNKELFSFPTFINHLLQVRLFPIFYKIPLIIIFCISSLNLFFKQPRQRLFFALLIIILTTYCYFISYNLIWEYHYTILLPTIPVFIFLYIKNDDRIKKRILKIILIFSALLYLPTPAFMFRNDIMSHLSIYRLTRVGMVLIIFLLFSYLVVLEIKKNLLLLKQPFSSEFPK